MRFLITDAVAAATTGAAHAPRQAGFSTIFMLGGFMLIFYFLMWRPQAKRAKEHRSMLAALQKGDEVVTGGGALGKINHVGEQFVTLEIAPNIEIKVQKPSIQTILPKGTIKGAANS